MVAMGSRHRSYGSFRGRVRLRRSAPGDMSLVINELQVNDTGRYRCEVIDGLEDDSVTVDLELRGKIFVCINEFGPQRESGWINPCGGHKNAVDFWFPEQEGAELSKIINQSNQSSVLEWRPLYGFTLPYSWIRLYASK